MKHRSKKLKFQDLFDVFKCVQGGKRVKRSRAKDGSISTVPIIEVSDLSEAIVLAGCLEWLRARNIVADRNNVGSGQIGESGFYSYGIKHGGDIIGLLPNGRHFELECKRGRGGRLSDGQQKRMRKVTDSNGYYFVIHGVEELEPFFRGLL